MPISKIKNAPPEVFHDRFLLLAIMLTIWFSIKLLEWILPERVLDFLPGPLPLAMLFVFVSIIVAYTNIIYFSQKWQAYANRNKLIAEIREKMGSNYEEKSQELKYPSIDVLVPAHNEKNVIVGTLQNLLEIDYPNYHIWIIDDRSIDKSAELVKKFIEENNLQNKVSLIERADSDFPGKAASLNQALLMTKGELIAVFDADARVQKDCLKLTIPYFQQTGVGGVQFQKKIYNAHYNTLALCQDLEFALDTYLQLGRDSLKGFVELRGNGQVSSRECLEEVGGWNETTLTDDLELSTRMYAQGWKIRFAPEITVEEEGVISPTALFKQRRRWAEGSLRRYLTHFYSFINPRGKMTLIQRLDILPFLCQFAVPIWIFLDCIVELIRFFNNQQTYITTLMLAFFLTSLSMWLNICIAVKRWRNYPFPKSLWYGSLAFMYGASHWPPIVLWTTRKVLFGRRPTLWNKTPRMLDLIKNKSQTKV